MDKRQREILKLIPKGHRLENRGGHVYVIKPDGEPARYGLSGRMIALPSSSSDYRNLKNMAAMIRREGIV